MLNGINNEGILNSQLDKKSEVSSLMSNPIRNPYSNIDKGLLIDETAISGEAMNLYQREQDVKQFTQLAMSDPGDTSHEALVSGLFSRGVTDVFSDATVESLAKNQKLVEDISSL